MKCSSCFNALAACSSPNSNLHCDWLKLMLAAGQVLNGNGILWLWLCQKKGKTFPVATGKLNFPLPWLCLWPSVPEAVLAQSFSSFSSLYTEQSWQEPQAGLWQAQIHVGGQVSAKEFHREMHYLPIHSKPHQGRGLQAGMFPQLHTDLPLQKAKQLQERVA